MKWLMRMRSMKDQTSRPYSLGTTKMTSNFFSSRVSSLINTPSCKFPLPGPALRLLVVPRRLVLDRPAHSTTALVIVFAVLVADLATRLAATVLTALLEAWVKIGTDDALVELGATNVLHAVEGVLVGVVFHEAEATGRLVEPVEAHDEALDLAALGEELVDLLFGGVEGQVADVEGGRIC